MERRTFLRSAAATAGVAALGGSSGLSRSIAAPLPPGGVRASSSVVVVGAGAFGGWTALHLAEMGAAVTLLDAYGPGNARSTSGGDTRGLRFAYGDREIYTRWAVEALGRWKTRQESWGEPLLEPAGRLSLFPQLTPALSDVAALLTRNGVQNEFLDPEEVARRWPQIALEGVGAAHFEPHAVTLRANRACRAVAAAVAREGGKVEVGRARPGAIAAGRMDGIVLDDGRRIHADAYLFACGPWLPQLFPHLLGGRIQVPRRDVFFFGPPPGDPRFSAPYLPNFSEGSRNVYGFPDLDGLGFKVAPFGGLEPFDPDADERVPAAHWVRRAREYLALRFPAMRDQPLVNSRVCPLENSPDDHFFLGRHPGIENLWIAGGGSGHGFKHGPVVGDLLARSILGGGPEPHLPELFRLDR